VTPPDAHCRYLNRDLSWLDFNERVLALAADPAVPLLERVAFCAIFANNLDEFFQVRVAALKDQIAGDVRSPSPDGRTPLQQLAEIRARVEELVARLDALFTHSLLPELEAEGIRFRSWEELAERERQSFVLQFHERMFPVLTPLAVDPSHPFPYISNLSLNLAVVLRAPDSPQHRFARVKVPPLFPRLQIVADSGHVVPTEQLVAAQLGTLFPGIEVVGAYAFRVTRNADLTFEDEEVPEDLLAAVETELRRRRFKKPVRLEIEPGMPPHVLDLLVDELELEAEDVYEVGALLHLAGLWELHNLDRPDLKFPPLSAAPEPAFAAAELAGDLFATLRQGDVLVHHPYNSFSSTVEEFIVRAATDPRVLAIKMTLYRTSGDSRIVDALIGAAESGKQVAVIIELKARFDEQANIGWAKRMEEVGVHVVYGVLGYKTHSKLVLVVRDEPDGLRRYCHIGTGNYNAGTARVYEDLGLFTTDEAIGTDVIRMFNFLTGFSNEPAFDRLLVAPSGLRPALRRLIEAERDAGERGRIVIKVNSLVDPELIESLYEASQHGVQIDLVVRGICCLVPGVPGQSETIRVRSIVGRYLEHSRLYHFANGGGIGVAAWYLGSADVMPRNLDRRVEALVPIDDPSLRARLAEILEVSLSDDMRSWRLGADGAWRPVDPRSGIEAHVVFHERADQRAGLR